MRYHYRVTKYNPALRLADGTFQEKQWTSFSDVGRVFNGEKLTEEEYLRVEEAYLYAIEALLREAKVEHLVVRGLENHGDDRPPTFIQEGACLNIDECVVFARIALRERIWGKLVAPGRAYVHFGYDFYLYIGLPARCTAAIAEVERRGIYVEPFRSPYLRARSNLRFDAYASRQ
jgi:hypothetical protein